VGASGAYLTTAVSSVTASATNAAIRLKEADNVTIAAPGLNGSLIQRKDPTVGEAANEH
jgi:hypothetical protein